MENIRLSVDHASVWIIDQSRLPNHEEELQLVSAEEMFEAIYHLRVRGAPAEVLASTRSWLCARRPVGCSR